jgi:putative endonuclease
MEDGESTRALGMRVEGRVADYLVGRGLSILERNVERAGGEIDLIALDLRLKDPEYVFIEVRSRSRTDRGSPLETVSVAKQRHVIRAATAWLVEHELWDAVAVRFDVVGVAIGSDTLRIRWIPGAYEA